MMDIHRMVRAALMAALMLLITAGGAQALTAMVIRIEGTRIILNKGSNDSLAPGQEFYVHRIGNPVGKIKTVLVDSFSSEASVVTLERDQTVRVGDVVTTEPFSVPYTPPPPALKNNDTWKSGAPSTGGGESQAYLDRLQSQIKVVSFKSGPKGQMRVGIGEVSLAVNALGYLSYASYADPWMLVTVGSGLLNQYNTSKKLGTESVVTVAVTYYDEALIASQARFFASKEGITDEGQIAEIKNGLVQQMGTDTSAVFHVKIMNKGKTVLQLAPFKWHMYLVNSAGQKVTASRYEDSLDKGVGPNSETQGYVYFPRTDETGSQNFSGGSVKIKLESILGGHKELAW
ncbi:MAG: hypothetical protein RDV48_18680 [Candidatus Eremiobacteraeota bacterium]|nr:hypothetical protein [Candidatus Eremiobacteraeota bacterium]